MRIRRQVPVHIDRSALSKRATNILTWTGGLYSLITLTWGFFILLGAGHGGPEFFILLPGSPVSVVSVFLPRISPFHISLLGIGWICNFLLWPWVAYLLADRRRNTWLAGVLTLHYAGIVALTLHEWKALSQTMDPADIIIYAGPYLSGQVLIWLFLIARRLASAGV